MSSSLLVRYRADRREGLGFTGAAGTIRPLVATSLSALLADPHTPWQDLPTRNTVLAENDYELLAPVDGRTEVWAAGVTYERSRDARVEESAREDIYSRIYVAERPELFFKAPAWRVVGHGGRLRVRSDSSDNVAEPELAVVADSRGRIVGYSVCDDLTSRSIEAENPLYLPQAKIWQDSCALGPGILLASSGIDPHDFTITAVVERNGTIPFAGEASVAQMTRTAEDLVDWLFREIDFPEGVVLSTGTGIVPHLGQSVLPGDSVRISITGVGELFNPVG